MKKQLIKKGLVASITVFAVMAIALPVFALENQTTNSTEKSESAVQREEAIRQKMAAQEKITQAKSEAATKAAEKREAAKTKLAEHKLKACQKREKNISNIMTRQTDRGVKQLEVFTKIADRTQAFYVEKGKTLSNYDALVAEVSAKKAAAQAAIDTTKSSTTTFKCDGTDPKGAADQFKARHKEHNEALKAYKTAVKNLIVGVKSVQSTTVKTDGGDQ